MTASAEGFVAYSLRAEYEDNYTGGLIVAGDSDFDVKAELDAGDGTIVTDVPAEIQALDDYPALKRVAVPADRLPREAPDPDEASKADLVKQAEELGVSTSGTKAELAERIAAALDDANLLADDEDDQGAGDGAEH